MLSFFLFVNVFHLSSDDFLMFQLAFFHSHVIMNIKLRSLVSKIYYTVSQPTLKLYLTS